MSDIEVTEASGIGPPIEVPVFTGPLDLLLHLIRKNRFSIHDIPIFRICDQYHQHLRQMQRLDLELAGEFLVMASWLLHLKSRTLLPKVSAEAGGEDPRHELVERLLEYRRVKDVAEYLYDTDVVRRCLWEPNVGVQDLGGELELDWEDVDLRVLARTYLEVMDRFSVAHPPPLQVIPLRFRVQDKMQELYDNVHKQKLMPLLRHLNSRSDQEEVVAVVVATLELVRLGGIRAEQRRVFAEIFLRPGPQPYDSAAAFHQEAQEPEYGN
ncbi:MAG: segregation/condensation protein A [Acidobacteria bacterium]|nr:segregation/condensation protein A [Acidobacteriota bacterium]